MPGKGPGHSQRTKNGARRLDRRCQPCARLGVGGPPQQGLSPVLGDRGVGLGRAVERDHVVLQHWLRLHRQVDKWGVCGEKRRPCRLWCCVHMRVKASNSTAGVSQSSHSPAGPQKTGGLGRGLPPSLEVPESGRPGSGLRTPARDSSYCCSATKLCPTLCDPMDFSTPGFPVLHYLPEFAQIHVHGVGGAVQPSRTLLSPSPPALNLS